MIYNRVFFAICFLLFAVSAFGLPVEKRGGHNNGGLVDALFDGPFDGSATFFHPETEGGSQGSCGPREDDDSPIVALNLHQYGNANSISKWCNKKILIKHNGKSTVATITDACPGCGKNSLDLTPSLFAMLDDLNKGVIDIVWCVLGTKGCKKD